MKIETIVLLLWMLCVFRSRCYSFLCGSILTLRNIHHHLISSLCICYTIYPMPIVDADDAVLSFVVIIDITLCRAFFFFFFVFFSFCSLALLFCSCGIGGNVDLILRLIMRSNLYSSTMLPECVLGARVCVRMSSPCTFVDCTIC